MGQLKEALRASIGMAPRGPDLVWCGVRAAAGGKQSLALPSVKCFSMKERERTHDDCFIYCLDKLGHYTE